MMKEHLPNVELAYSVIPPCIRTIMGDTFNYDFICPETTPSKKVTQKIVSRQMTEELDSDSNILESSNDACESYKKSNKESSSNEDIVERNDINKSLRKSDSDWTSSYSLESILSKAFVCYIVCCISFVSRSCCPKPCKGSQHKQGEEVGANTYKQFEILDGHRDELEYSEQEDKWEEWFCNVAIEEIV